MSEDLEIEQTMFEDKLKTTDWEATNEAIEEQIARESYLQWCREKHQAQKQKQNVHSNVMQQQLMLSSNTIQSSSTITSTTTGGKWTVHLQSTWNFSFWFSCSFSARWKWQQARLVWLDRTTMQNYIRNHHVVTLMTVHPVNRLIITAIICHQPLDHRIRMRIDHKAKIRKFHSRKTFGTLAKSFISLLLNRRSRKRRSNRRKTAQQTMLNVCNAGLAPLNEVTENFETLPNSSYVMNPNTVTENLASNTTKKRKFSSQDVPGPSSYYTKGSPKQAPMSEFYHSLLESSYHDNFNGTYILHFATKQIMFSCIWFVSICLADQLTEEEMIEKAIQMSRLEFMQSKAI